MTNDNDSGDDGDKEYIDHNFAVNNGVHNDPDLI